MMIAGSCQDRVVCMAKSVFQNVLMDGLPDGPRDRQYTYPEADSPMIVLERYLLKTYAQCALNVNDRWTITPKYLTRRGVGWLQASTSQCRVLPQRHNRKGEGRGTLGRPRPLVSPSRPTGRI
eukprot:TRINITY_DN8323_c0_g3_i1.p1 TRINITY_DN8323_c0_g3~~TRINITY_DN8323_c0_g3_i1.p1  ORF type:complete len:123 (-),score=6.80 TRINITY_DN8323_c0_g3_i1:404-772(-)